ncbi:MAG TPA: hypothetical protein VGI60_04950 [Chthoniobacterales bacterium]|jgi:hypothetical protein
MKSLSGTASFGDLVAGLPWQVPIILLPLRIETRFKTTGRTTELWIRIYPDTIHVDTHEPELTEDEIGRATSFWQLYYATGATTDTRALAWKQLVQRFGKPRTAWITKTLTPTVKRVGKDVTLTFPTNIPTRAASWTRPALVRALPNQWMAIGFVEGVKGIEKAFEHESALIVDEIEAGPNPSATYEDPGDGSMLIDPEMKWMVDFDEAVARGMAMRVPLTGTAVDGLALLVVVGVKSFSSGADGQLSLQGLLEAHHYASGLSFVRPGVPTNITEESEDVEEESDADAMTREIGRLVTPGSESNARTLTAALGFDDDLLDRVERGADSDQQEAADMNEALWPATLGYFLEAMMTGYLNDEDLEWVREHFVDNARARGCLPTIRINEQPYGFVPVAYDGTMNLYPGGVGPDMDVPVSGNSDDPSSGDTYRLLNLRGLLQNLRSKWMTSMASAPYLSKDSDPDKMGQDLAKIFAMNPQPYRFAVRAAVPSEYFGDIKGLTLKDAVDLLETDLGIGGDPALLNVIYTPGSLEWVGPLVQSDKLSWSEPFGDDNYVSWILENFGNLANEDDGGVEGNDSLLYLLLRQAGTRAETDTVDAQDRFKNALTALERLPTAALEQLLLETISLCSARLDAWDISLTNAHLANWRDIIGKAKGALVGAYGWVGGLEPSTQVQSRLGYVHAPSTTHAATAAMLRSAWAGSSASSKTSLAVNLTSDRIRTAKWVLESVRAGQTLNNILGYQFERALHDTAVATDETPLDQYLDEFRELYPQVLGRIDENYENGETDAATMAAGQVVDGLALMKAWQEDADAFFADVPDAPRTYIEPIVSDLQNTLDAASDALTAESVHQLVQGNVSRLSATLDAACSGDAPVPDLLFPNTPYRGSSITHRLLFLAAETGPPSVWPAITGSARAALEPNLESWVAAQLGSPGSVVIAVDYLPAIGEGDTILQSTTFTLQEVVLDLQMGALDFLAVLPSDDTQRRSELDERIRWHSMRVRDSSKVPETARVQITYTRSDDIPADSLALAEFTELGRAIRRILTSSRGATAYDLALPTDSVEEVIDIADLSSPMSMASRAAAIAGAGAASWNLAVRLAALQHVLRGTNTENVRIELVKMANIGIPGAFPHEPVGDTDEVRTVIYAQASRVVSRVKTLQATIAKLNAAFDSSTASSTAAIKHYTEVIQSVLGKTFVVLPRFKAWNPTELAATFAASTSLQGGDPTAVFGWLSSVARVRPGAARLERFVLLKESLQDQLVNPGTFSLTVGQLPNGDSTWAAMNISEKDLGVGGRASLVVHLPSGTIGLDGWLQGFVTDEWNEKLPRSDETSSVAFHFDSPGARPPNAVLLCTAWNPSPEQGWRVEDIYGSVVETFFKAKFRMVDTATAQDVGQFLPAIFIPTDASDGHVESDLMRGVIQKPG